MEHLLPGQARLYKAERLTQMIYCGGDGGGGDSVVWQCGCQNKSNIANISPPQFSIYLHNWS